MTNYEVTIGYKAVITVSVKADNEENAKEKALSIFGKNRDKMLQTSLQLQDDSFAAHGIVNMDETWNAL